MMEQMLKLCMFLMRAKLTITEAAGRSGGGGGGVGVFGCQLWVDIFGLFTYALKVQSKIKNKMEKKEKRECVCVCVCVRNESELKARIEYISCLHPGALRAQNT